jgi:hypothetical protein
VSLHRILTLEHAGDGMARKRKRDILNQALRSVAAPV